MSTDLLHNVKESLARFLVQNTFSWLDITVALHWIKGGGEYKQFVNHRVRKIEKRTINNGDILAQQRTRQTLGIAAGKSTNHVSYGSGDHYG